MLLLLHRFPFCAGPQVKSLQTPLSFHNLSEFVPDLSCFLGVFQYLAGPFFANHAVGLFHLNYDGISSLYPCSVHTR